MMNHDYVMIQGRKVLHSTATRDCVCGYCESGLITLFKDGEWVTQCSEDEKHSPDGFIKKTELEAIKFNRMLKAAQGRDILAHLPDELKNQILGGNE